MLLACKACGYVFASFRKVEIVISIANEVYWCINRKVEIVGAT